MLPTICAWFMLITSSISFLVNLYKDGKNSKAKSAYDVSVSVASTLLYYGVLFTCFHYIGLFKLL